MTRQEKEEYRKHIATMTLTEQQQEYRTCNSRDKQDCIIRVWNDAKATR